MNFVKNSEPGKAGIPGEEGGSPLSGSSWAAAERVAPAARPPQSPPWIGPAWWVAALPLVIFILLPIVGLFSRSSLRMVLENIGSPVVLQALGISLRTTLISLGLILLLGTPLAYGMARYQFRYKKVLDTLIDLPTVLPPSVAGIALLITFGRRGLVGAWLDELGIQLAFSTAAVVIAQVFIASPFYVRAATIGFAAIDTETLQAAQIDGASRQQIFWYITLPLSRKSLLSGSVLSWARALGEFGATMIFAGNFPGRTQTMPLAIYLGFERDIESALTLSILLILTSFATLLITRILITRESE